VPHKEQAETLLHHASAKAPARLHRAVRVLAEVGGSQRIDGLEAPLTGRDAELRTVKEPFHAAADRRVPRLVPASGAAAVSSSHIRTLPVRSQQDEPLK
jgi:hypothetical protein